MLYIHLGRVRGAGLLLLSQAVIAPAGSHEGRAPEVGDAGVLELDVPRRLVCVLPGTRGRHQGANEARVSAVEGVERKQGVWGGKRMEE